METEEKKKCKCCGKEYDPQKVREKYPSIDEGVCGLMCDGSVADDFPEDYQ